MAQDIETMFERNYISALDLEEGGDTLVTIEKVERKSIKGRDGNEELKPVAVLTEPLVPGGPRQWILNKTNGRRLKAAIGTGNPDQWKGVTVSLFVDHVDVGGEVKAAIRVRPTLPNAGAVSPAAASHVLANGDNIPF